MPRTVSGGKERQSQWKKTNRLPTIYKSPKNSTKQRHKNQSYQSENR